MNESSEVYRLLSETLANPGHPAVLWQTAILAIALLLAWSVDRLIRRHMPRQEGAWKLGIGGVNRIIFPLAALLVVVFGKALIRHWYPHHTNLLALAGTLLTALALIRLVVYALRHAFPPSGWLQASERFTVGMVLIGFTLHATGLLPEIIHALDDFDFTLGKQRISLLKIINAAAAIAVTMIVAMWIGRASEKRIMSSEHIDLNLRVVLTKVVKALLIFVGILIALSSVGIDLTLLSVFGGALGVALGLGLQKIASNYVSGFIILLDRSIRIGDLVTIDNRYGEVTSITSRCVVVKNRDGTEAIIPNEILITSTVINHSYTNQEVRVQIPVQISYDSPLEIALQLMLGAAQRHPRVLAEPPPKAFLASFGDNGINLELRLWIKDPEEGQMSLRSEINLAIWQSFQENGVEIPYPQREVRLIGQYSPEEIAILGEQHLNQEEG
ncbi:MAG: mechanosensitive ion channel family protein [Burkholderiales bacterium]